jgi:hypothetical protein
MPILRYALPASFVACAVACGPVHDDTHDAAETTGTTDASSSTDDTGAPPLDDSTSVAGSETESSGPTPGDGSSDDAGDTSSESGGVAPVSTRFELTGKGATMEPEGCAGEGGEPDSEWSIELTLPEGDGEFTLTETFGPYVTLYDCTAMDGGFACAHETTVDYSRFSEMDAVVHHASSYDVDSFDPNGIDGTYAAEFVCTGTDCDSALRQWSIAAFPCALAVTFTGAPVRGR